MKQIVESSAKYVKTYDSSGNQNGYLVELGKDGDKTIAYLTAAFPGCFKGYHAHKIREANYVCIKGKVKIILITKDGKKEIILNANSYKKLHIPINTPTGISNEWEEEAWIVNIPSPPYDPELINEQLDFNEEEATRWIRDI